MLLFKGECCFVQPLSRRLRRDSSPSRGALGKRFVFHVFACGSKTNYFHKEKHYASRAKCSEASALENATECQSLPY